MGCEPIADERIGRPKYASAGTGLSDVDISYDQSSRRKKFATVPEETSRAKCREKPAFCRRLVTISQGCSQSELLAKAEIGSGAGMASTPNRTLRLAGERQVFAITE
jgi:hypothetical protein